jgi:hypothetical protein
MYCTICERSTHHVAASCPRRPGIALIPMELGEWRGLIMRECTPLPKPADAPKFSSTLKSL